MHMKDDTRSSLFEMYRPSLIPIEANLIAAVFPLMKIIPAEFCVRQAREAGLITPDSLIVESSSGTMALGLAIVCKAHGYKATLVTDNACDDGLQRRLEDLGATVEKVTCPAPTGGYQRARLERLRDICASTKDHWWLNQYDNPANARSYGAFADYLLQVLGHVDCLVATVGSGGSACGTARALRERSHRLHLIGVDTFGSVLFGQPDAPRKLRGLGNSLCPRNLDHTAFDEIHWISAAEANMATRKLHQKTTLFRGATSGACWWIARQWALRHPNARVVCIFPDDGYRYMHSVYDDNYLRENELWLSQLPTDPIEVTNPLHAETQWSWIRWNRRSYREILGVEPLMVASAATVGEGNCKVLHGALV
jgi:cysteine synthase